MAGTRSSARQAAAAAASSSPSSSQAKQGGPSGTKRKGATTASPQAKRGKKGAKKAQTTIEETMPQGDAEESKDVEMKDEPGPGDEGGAQAAEENGGKEDVTEPANADAKVEDSATKDEAATTSGDVSKAEDGSKMDKVEAAGNAGDDSKATNGTTAVESSSKREESTPSSILEKGIIYFFERGRVGIDEPSKPDEIARSYIILRPVPHGAKLGEGPIGDGGKNRMLALPKKVLPKSPKDVSIFGVILPVLNDYLRMGCSFLERVPKKAMLTPNFTTEVHDFCRKSQREFR